SLRGPFTRIPRNVPGVLAESWGVSSSTSASRGAKRTRAVMGNFDADSGRRVGRKTPQEMPAATLRRSRLGRLRGDFAGSPRPPGDVTGKFAACPGNAEESETGQRLYERYPIPTGAKHIPQAANQQQRRKYRQGEPLPCRGVGNSCCGVGAAPDVALEQLRTDSEIHTVLINDDVGR